MNKNTVNDVNELREIIANQAIEIHRLKKELAAPFSKFYMWLASELEKQIDEYEGGKTE